MIRWKEYRVKDVAKKIGSGATPNSNNDKYYDNGIFHWINTGDFNNSDIYFGKQMITEQALNEVSALRFYPVDTVLVAMYGASIGKIGLLKVKATVNQACCAIVPDRRLCLPRYLFYVLMNNKDSFLQKSFGGTQPNISQTIVSNLVLYIPSLSVQQRIVDYLDEKLAKIDGRIAVLEKQQEAYARLKKSVIHQAVTCGLNPNVPLKDSGIEWIGMIPEHWKVKRIKDLCSFVSRGSTPDYVDESDFPVMNQAVFSSGCINNKVVRYSSYMKPESQIEKGDLLIASTGGGILGKLYFFNDENEKFYADTHVTIVRSPKKKFYVKFLYYLFSIGYSMINSCMAKGSTNQTELQRDKLIAYEIAIPSIEEQTKIVEYLDDKCAKIDAAIENIGKQIDASKRLKRALINEVITGQRAV